GRFHHSGHDRQFQPLHRPGGARAPGHGRQHPAGRGLHGGPDGDHGLLPAGCEEAGRLRCALTRSVVRCPLQLTTDNRQLTLAGSGRGYMAIQSTTARTPLGLKIGVGAVLLFLYFPFVVILLYAFSTEDATFTFPPPGLTIRWFA